MGKKKKKKKKKKKDSNVAEQPDQISEEEAKEVVNEQSSSGSTSAVPSPDPTSPSMESSISGPLFGQREDRTTFDSSASTSAVLSSDPTSPSMESSTSGPLFGQQEDRTTFDLQEQVKELESMLQEEREHHTEYVNSIKAREQSMSNEIIRLTGIVTQHELERVKKKKDKEEEEKTKKEKEMNTTKGNYKREVERRRKENAEKEMTQQVLLSERKTVQDMYAALDHLKAQLKASKRRYDCLLATTNEQMVRSELRYQKIQSLVMWLPNLVKQAEKSGEEMLVQVKLEQERHGWS